MRIQESVWREPLSVQSSVRQGPGLRGNETDYGGEGTRDSLRTERPRGRVVGGVVPDGPCSRVPKLLSSLSSVFLTSPREEF